MIPNIFSLNTKLKISIVATYDILAATIAFPLSFCLRFSNLTPPTFSETNFAIIFFSAIIVQYISFYATGLYKGIWRFSSTPDLIKVIKGCTLGVISTATLLLLMAQHQNIPRSIYIIDWLLLIVFIGGGRFFYRIFKDSQLKKKNFKNSQRTIILGAGNSGAQLAREILHNNSLPIKIVGFLDDDPHKVNRSIHGIQVFGQIKNLKDITSKHNIQHAIIAMPSATSAEMRLVVNHTTGCNITIQTLPRLSDILNGKVEFSQLRKIKPEDLLGRESVKLNLETVVPFISNKKILITGAGGSIGSELCRQVCKLNPSYIIAYETTELFLYQLKQTIKKEFPNIRLIPVIGDVRDEQQVRSIFETYRPEVVFHAAAYKHVPMMELNPIESIRTNIKGTLNVANQASFFNTERFILVSTDKAVNPTNIMGTTKRIAEMICKSIQQQSDTRFMVVRFGNVLGSSGSVVPLFKKQIEDGGPVTVTHEDITRYFMSIPEATQLVIQAGALGSGGEIFVLDMGEPVKIMNLAKELISLAGFTPNKDIEIKVTGLRPGEKLYEELLSDKETTLPTLHEKIRIASSRDNEGQFIKKLSSLLRLNHHSSAEEIIQQLKELVPEFDHQTNKINQDQQSDLQPVIQ